MMTTQGSKNRRISVYLILLVMMVVFPVATESAGTAGIHDNGKCIDIIKISRDDHPWKGMTQSSRQEEMNKHIPAAEINKETCEVFPHLLAYQIHSENLLGKDKLRKIIVISSRYFSDLEKADATRIQAGTVKKIGRFLDTSFISFSPRRLVRFLLDAQIITTYWHLESELCLIGEKEEKDGYTAFFTGVHRYCTNRCEADPLNFAVRIDRKTGEISVAGY
jgi:hypothetical protein